MPFFAIPQSRLEAATKWAIALCMIYKIYANARNHAVLI
jgi:hypothetical protein